jgi:hypothetical protein
MAIASLAIFAGVSIRAAISSGQNQVHPNPNGGRISVSRHSSRDNDSHSRIHNHNPNLARSRSVGRTNPDASGDDSMLAE